MDATIKPGGVCCCCLEECNYRSLWKKYQWLENSEVYGNMLNDVFGVDYHKIVTVGVEKQICETCINRLRHATIFRKQVLQSYSTLQNQVHLGKIKNEMSADYEDVKPKLDSEVLSDYQDICYLDDDNADAAGEIKDERIIKIEINSDEDDVKPELDSKDHFDSQDVCCDDDSAAAACEMRVKPLKVAKDKHLTTISKSRLKSSQTTKITTPSTSRPRKGRPFFKEMNRQYRHNVSLLLRHTTICPFNSNQTYFMCIYCNKPYVNFDQLNDHVIELHESVDYTKYQYKIDRKCKRMRVEVSNIQCRICAKPFDNLETIIDHLRKAHNVEFIYDVSKPLDCVVGFELRGGKYKCSICKEEFHYFKTLTTHVNGHFTDFICDICGKNFLGQENLSMHKKTHNKTHVRCKFCHKIYAASALKQHVKYTHTSRTYPCSVCKEVFVSLNSRMDHLVEMHGRVRPNLSCVLCCRCFISKSSLQCHIRTSHMKPSKHPCPDCGKLFPKKNMGRHSLVHSGEKNHECSFCHKRFGRKTTLKEHLKIHNNDKRWSCVECSQSFVQKCSLENHIKVHHKECSNKEELMCYTYKPSTGTIKLEHNDLNS